MRILLIGELSWSYVVGSSTKKIQSKIFSELKNHDMNVQFFEICPNDSIIKRLFKRLSIDQNNLIRGGVLRLFKKLYKERYEIVHFLVLRNYMILFLPLLFLRTKFIVTLHDTYSMRGYEKKRLNHFIRILLLKFASAVVVFTKSDKIIANHYHKNNSSIFIMKHGSNKISISKKNEEQSNNSNILFAGGLGKHHKGLDFLEKALSLIQVNYKLIICGTNFSNEFNNNYIGALEENSYIRVLLQSKVVVVPSKYESFSLVALESLTYGIPVILTKSTGISDYLIDGRGCFIVEYGDVKNLAEKIEVLLTNDILWNKMSREAIIVAKEFDWKKIIKSYISLYRQLLNESK